MGPLSLPSALEQEERGRHADVETLDRRSHRDSRQDIAGSRHQRPYTATFGPEDQHHPSAKVELPEYGAGRHGRTENPGASSLGLLKERNGVGDLSDRQVFDDAGRGLDGGRCHGCRPMPGQDEPRSSGGSRAPRYGADIVRVGHLVQNHDEVAAQDLLNGGVAERIYLQRDALMLVAPGDRFELGRRDDIDG